MTRQTIDYGIDLGTTNSTVAVLAGTTTEIVSNKEGSTVTPSAIWFDKRGSQYVGREARAKHLDDPDNAAVEFKLRMGEDWQKVFKRSGRRMSPEEMSAEVLKSLRTDVRTNKGEDLNAAVITVPAAFELPQSEATRRAAELAGFVASPLLQEPVAAALAYGFQSASDKVFWLVYDFGGGTFDAAIIQLRDGVIQVVNHAGDNYLGGKNIDWDIVDKLLIPRLIKAHPLADFKRDNPKWRAAIAKLKHHAEEGKIHVSRTQQPWEYWIEDLCMDDRGEPVEFHLELTPADLQRVIEPWTAQSINLCKRALREKNLSGKDLEKTILVGGSSLFPWLQEMVATELGAKLDFSIDPITVVARGAAVFAGTQRLVADHSQGVHGTYKIDLEYEPVGSESDPMMGGRITPPAGGTAQGLVVEIVENRSQWRSGAIRLNDKGAFVVELHAEKGRKCEYQILLTDPRGSALECSPSHFSYTVGMVITAPPLTHSIGVAKADNKMAVFFHKGEPLPARYTHLFKTAVTLRKGKPRETGNEIIIPICEGENESKAGRNRLIGRMEILPDDPRIKRDIPLGSEVEVTMVMDTSRTVTTTAYIPMIDETFDAIFKAYLTPKTADDLRSELREELARLEALRGKSEEVDEPRAQAHLEQLEHEQLVEIAQRQISATKNDPDARPEADKKLLLLKAAVDSVEDALEWPTLVEEVKRQLAETQELVERSGDKQEKDRLRLMEKDIEKAISGKRTELLKSSREAASSLASQVRMRQPEFWIGFLHYLQENKDRMEDQKIAERLFSQASRAAQNQDLEALEAAVRQLLGLLPRDEQAAMQAKGGFLSTLL